MTSETHQVTREASSGERQATGPATSSGSSASLMGLLRRLGPGVDGSSALTTCSAGAGGGCIDGGPEAPASASWSDLADYAAAMRPATSARLEAVHRPDGRRAKLLTRLVVPTAMSGIVIDELSLVAAACDSDDWDNVVVYLPFR